MAESQLLVGSTALAIETTAEATGMRHEVLVVDDSRHVRHLLRDSLGALGVRIVHEAEDGAEACRMLESGVAPDMVISDIMMTPLNGLDLLRVIRSGETATHPFIPVILVSGYSGLKNVRDAADLGANGFIRKPFTANEIAEKVRIALLRPPMFVRTRTYFGPDRRAEPRQRTTGGEDCAFFIPCPRRYGEYVQAHPAQPGGCGACGQPGERCRGFFSIIERSGYRVG